VAGDTSPNGKQSSFFSMEDWRKSSNFLINTMQSNRLEVVLKQYKDAGMILVDRHVREINGCNIAT
jgi:hypothetical protein